MPHYTLSFKKLQISGACASILTFSIARSLPVILDSLFNADYAARGMQLCKSNLLKEEELRTEI